MRLLEYAGQQLKLFPELDDETVKFERGNFSFRYDREVIDRIKHECSDIIREYKKVGHVLWRGTKSTSRIKKEISPNIWQAFSRTDRRPTDTSRHDQEAIDEVFKKKFGWKPRAEGTFASASIQIARSYGLPHIFLPENGYKYLWSDQYNDLYSDYFESTPTYAEYNPFDYSGHWINTETGEKYEWSNEIPEKRLKSVWVQEYLNDEHTKMMFIHKTDTDNPPNKEKEVHYEWVPKVTKEQHYENQSHQLDDVVDTYKDYGLNKTFSRRCEVMFKTDYYYLIQVKVNDTNDWKDLQINEFGF